MSRKENSGDRLPGPERDGGGGQRAPPAFAPPPSSLLLEIQKPQQVRHPSRPVCLLELTFSFSAGVKTSPESSAAQAGVSRRSPRWLLTRELTERSPLRGEFALTTEASTLRVRGCGGHLRGRRGGLRGTFLVTVRPCSHSPGSCAAPRTPAVAPAGHARALATHHLSHLPLSLTPQAGTAGGGLCGAPTPTPSTAEGGRATRCGPACPVNLDLALRAAPLLTGRREYRRGQNPELSISQRSSFHRDDCHRRHFGTENGGRERRPFPPTTGHRVWQGGSALGRSRGAVGIICVVTDSL